MLRDDKRSMSRASQIAQAYRSAHEVMSAALSIALLAGGGYWLDRRCECQPLLTIVGACLGFIMAGVSLRRLLRRLDREAAVRRSGADSKRSAIQ